MRLLRLVSFVLFLPAVGNADPVQDGVSYLLSQQSGDGTFGATTQEDALVATPEALTTLNLLGLGQGVEAQSAALGLASLAPAADTELLLRRELALYGSAFALPFDSRTTTAAGFDADDVSGLSWSLLADRAQATSYTADGVAKALQLAALAQADGCFATEDDDTTADVTALALMALRAAQSHPTVAATRAAALSCLVAKQQAGGSFGTVATTALALLALQESSGDYSTPISQARVFLFATQQADGGWGSVRATSLALRALTASSASPLPDWAMKTDATGAAWVTVLTPNLNPGQPLKLVVHVTNQSSVAAPPVVVRFRAVPKGGGASVTLGEDIIPALGPGGSIDWDTSVSVLGLFGKYVVYADVNPDSLAQELDYSNNEASGLVDIEGGPDLAVATTSLVMSPLSSTSAQVTATVINYGGPTDAPAVLNVYKGSTTGTVIGTATIPAGLASNQTFSFNFTWNTTGLNGPTAVFLVADATNAVAESNEGNNTTFRYYDPSSTGPVDLTVQSAASPPPVLSGKPFTINAVVQNLSAYDANNVPVALVLNGVTLSQVEVPSVPAHGTAPVALTGVITGSPTGYPVVVFIDPDNVLGEANRGNNQLVVPVTVTASAAVELQLSALTPAPATASNGQTFTLTVVAGNAGTQLANSVIRVTDEVDGSELEVQPIALAANTNRTVALGTFSSPNRNMSLRACIDPYDAYAEHNENNNCTEVVVGQAQGAALVVRSRDMASTPVGPDVGEAVTLSATVRNLGTASGSGVVEFWQGRPDGAEGHLLGQRSVSIAAGASQQVSVPWIREEGAAEFYARITRLTSREPSGVVDPTNANANPNISPAGFKTAGRHLFLEEIIDATPLAPYEARWPHTAVAGRLTGAAAPELVVGWVDRSGFLPPRATVEVLGMQGGRHTELWSDARTNYNICDISLVDLEGDGRPEVLATYTRQDVPALAWRAFEPDGTLKWQQEIPVGHNITDPCGDSGHLETPLADWNHDGVVDIIGIVNGLIVVSGDDGRVLLNVPEPGLFTNLQSNFYTTFAHAVDVAGTGSISLYSSAGPTFLLDNAGGVTWSASIGGNGPYETPIADLTGDGQPEFVWSAPPGGMTMREVATGAVVAGGSATVVYSIGGVRQNGLRYLAAGNFPNQTTGVYRPDLVSLWATPTTGQGGDPVLADVLGLGRPQLIVDSPNYAPLLLDGRTGKLELPVPAPWGDPTSGYQPFGYSNSQHTGQPPAVADLHGDGTSRLFMPAAGGDSNGYSGLGPEYGNAEALVFGSAHWKKMPTAWPQRVVVKGRIGEDLKFNSNSPDAHRWWTTHNTFNEQFDVEPEHLLPDFTVAAPHLQGPATALQPFTLTATLNNVGGLPASNVDVAFYDGDPSSGGVRLGTSTVAGPLAVRTGTSPVSFSWDKPWPEGRHTIYVVANPDSAIEESGHEDNTAHFTLFVHAPTQACDLSLDAASLAASAAAPGQPQTLSATVSNVGSLDCPAVVLSVYDGPVGNTVLLGTAQVPALSPGQQVPLQVTSDAAASNQVVRFLVDEAGVAQDDNLLNNQASLLLDNGDAPLPDLRVATLTASPQAPYPGEPTTLSAVVVNSGTPSTATDVTFSWGGLTVSMPLPSLPNSGTATVTATLPAPAVPGLATATADNSNVVTEYDESNNTASLAVPEAVPSVAVTVSASPANAPAGSNVSVQVTLSDSAATAQATQLVVDVLDASGNVVANLLSTDEVVAGQGSVVVPATWLTGATQPGGYAVRARASVGGRLEATGVAAVTLTEPMQAHAQLATARGVYSPTETVAFTARVSNPALVQTLDGATAVLTVTEPGTGNVLYTSTRVVPTLGAGAHYDFVDAFAVSVSAQLGLYPTRLDVLVGGNLLSTATASFQVTASTAKTVKVVTTAAPVFDIGPPLSVSVAVDNLGSQGLTNSSLTVLLLESGGTTLTLLDSQTQSLTLAAGQSTTVPFSLATLLLQPGPKLVVTQLDGRVVSTLMLEAVPVVDHEPPVILVTGVSDLQLGNQDVTAVISITDASPFTSSALLDGQPFTSGTVVSAEGDHLLVVTATDVYNNSSAVMVRFTLDKTPPSLTLTGVADGAVLGAPVTLTFDAADAHPGVTQSTMDGAPFNSGDTVSSEGDHAWVVTSTDGAGNTASQTVHFSLDFTPPVLTVAGVADGAYYDTPVAPVFGATDVQLVSVTATLDGNAFTSGTPVDTEGAHVLSVTATDAAGNSSSQTVHFTLDFTPPVLSLTGPSDGALLNSAQLLLFDATDANPVTVSSTLNGSGIPSGTLAVLELDYAWVVTAVDAAGNTVTETRHFTLDFTPPALTVSAPADGALVGNNPTVTYSAADLHGASASATVDGLPFGSGGIVSGDGAHTLVVTAVDGAGNQAAPDSRTFTIDTLPPVLTLSGPSEGAVLNTPQTLTFGAVDPHLDSSSPSSTLNNNPIASGTTVSTEGDYTWVVSASDTLGHTTSQTRHFSLDFTAPVVTVSGVVDGALYGAPVTPAFSASDTHLAQVTATVDGVDFSSGTTVSTDGAHVLVVTATDTAGNSSGPVTVHFTLDTTPPVISVTGVTEGATGASFTISYSATDASSVTVSATLDGNAFTSGDTVSSNGAHTLVVTATDAAGNTATQTVHFTVAAEMTPTFQYGVCALGNLLVESNAKIQAPSGQVTSVATDGTLSAVGNAIISGDSVSNGNTALNNNAIIYGTAYYGGSYSQLSNSHSAAHQQVSPAPSPCVCGYDLQGRLADAQAQNDDALLNGNPAYSNGALNVAANTTLTLSSGRYYFTTLHVYANAHLQTVAGANVQIFVQGNVTVENNGYLGASTTSPPVLLVSGASSTDGGSVQLLDNTAAALLVYAPQANLTLANNATLVGAVVGNNVTLDNNQIIKWSGPQTVPPPLTCP